MDLPLVRSPWSVASERRAARALEHHADRLAHWLSGAGAEPRLCAIYSSGAGATATLVDLLHAHGLEVVRVRATADSPVPAAVIQHQGDHFNKTLYLMDVDQPSTLGALDGLRGRLEKVATWVGLLIEDPATADALRAQAPGLRRALMRTCVVADGLVAAPAGGGEQVAERVFAALSADGPADLLDFDRLVRAGYAGLLLGQAVHPSWQRLAALWATPDALPFDAAQADPAAVAAAWRAGLEGVDPTALDDATRFALGLPVEDALLADLARLDGADAPLIDRIRRAIDAPGVGPGLRVHAELRIGRAFAADEDVEGLRIALDNAVKLAGARGVAPELRFEVLEAAVRLRAALGERTAARGLLDALEALAPRLCSPHYDCRALAARGEFVAPLDAARARVDLLQAASGFAAHGYPEWAARAEAAVP